MADQTVTIIGGTETTVLLDQGTQTTVQQPVTFATVTVETVMATAPVGSTDSLTTADVFSDFVVSGLLSPTSANLVSILAAGVAYVTGMRTAVAATPFTYAPSSDTYDDLASSGIITHVAVANGAPAPAITANNLRLQKVVSSGTAITAVTNLAPNAQITLPGFPKVTGQFYFTDYITGTPDLTGATDYTAQLNAAHAAMYAANGGTLMFPAGNILIAGQIYLPNDGGLIPAPTQKAIKWQGMGGYYNGQNALGVGGTRLILTYVGAAYNNAKIITRGLGVFRIEDMVLQDTTANAVTPFLYTTCTTLKISNCAFLGATAQTSCTQDAIVLGGTIDYPTGPTGNGYGDPDAPFQGYGTKISGCYFNRIRRGVYGRMYCNQVVVSDLFFDKGCGTNLVGGACVEFDGGPNVAYSVGTNSFNVITGNYFENSGGYYYQVKLTACSGTYVAGNACEDASPGGVLVALVGCFGYTRSSINYPSIGNNIIGSNNAIGITLFEDALSLGKNTVLGNTGIDGNRIQSPLHLLSRQLFIPDISGAGSFTLRSETNQDLVTFFGDKRAFQVWGPILISGNAAAGGAAALTVGDASAGTGGSIIINPSSGGLGQVQFKRAGTNSWLLYDAASSTLFLRDNVNSKMHMTFNPGAGTGGSTELNSALKVLGNSGFAGATPIARRATTADATDLASVITLSNAIKADLVAYGLKS